MRCVVCCYRSAIVNVVTATAALLLEVGFETTARPLLLLCPRAAAVAPFALTEHQSTGMSRVVWGGGSGFRAG